ncbi:MAG: DM13 domain-containing protein [Myxococcota bacterium]
MARSAWLSLVIPISFLVTVIGCGDSGGGAPAPGGPSPTDPPAPTTAGVGSTGEQLYLLPHDDGNTFACATCHALEEPPANGIRRAANQIGNAALRATYKNGQTTEFREAVNTCRVEWMRSTPFEADDVRWAALSGFLTEEAGAQEAPDLSFEIVVPPTELDGGDPLAGQELFNSSCVGCHGVDAVGTVRAPSLTGAFLDAETIARRIRTSGSVNSSVYVGLTGGTMPFWAAERLTDDEVVDLVAFVLQNDPQAGGAGNDVPADLRQCDATHPNVGQIAELDGIGGRPGTFHQISGIATIVDDCTIRVDEFFFDGAGIDVRFYSGLGGDYLGGFSMSENDLRRPPPGDGTLAYNGETVYAQLPEGQTLDDLDGISVWCVPVDQSFADGLFRNP